MNKVTISTEQATRYVLGHLVTDKRPLVLDLAELDEAQRADLAATGGITITPLLDASDKVATAGKAVAKK